MMTGLVLWLLLGAIIGFLGAGIISGIRQAPALILLGIIGAGVGGSLGQIISSSHTRPGLNGTALCVAILGALALIGFYKNISPQS